MRVTQAQKARGATGSRSAKGAKGAARDFTLPSMQGEAKRTEFSAPAAVSSIDVIVALQSVSGPEEQNRQAADKGVKILDLLDDIKVGLLSGGVSSGDLDRLKRMVADAQADASDPALKDILKQIDLRARVELAKYKGNAA